MTPSFAAQLRTRQDGIRTSGKSCDLYAAAEHFRMSNETTKYCKKPLQTKGLSN